MTSRRGAHRIHEINAEDVERHASLHPHVLEADVPASKIDRRIARTRRKLEHAFFHLIQDKGYDAVTIQDICEKAGVGRSTFYTHFTGKDDLKRRSLEHLRAELSAYQTMASTTDPGKALSFSLGMFEHARRHVGAYRGLIGSEGLAVSLGGIRGIIADLIRAELAGQGDRQDREIRVAFVVGAFMSVLTNWLDNGAKIEPADIDVRFRSLLFGGLSPG
ncbi:MULTISPECIES: TetR/AcrR family transcriptional regulator [Asticcacaulis]|uniref:TetR/AcrR family transcriptional regulator n=1 Tax=Asticcacaulis TaxID=76890 RepID=UPI001AE86EA1|nr:MULTISPECIES: TetR/AcrR family transcriptional regulator [Asticcacaulis]MBP2159029.1 AcrR family transcriptional regulator [Asticcacaulis solisilvae]MDR6800074.1 AcrR family transcriptional regulator [Asticcacaulis sp. BE141]